MPDINQRSRASFQQPPDNVARQMGDYVDLFVSAIGLVKPDDDRDPPGDHLGTGGFILLNGGRYLLTCEHVARKSKHGMLACTQFGSEYGISVANLFSSLPYPVDAAASRLSERSWSLVSHKAQCIDSSMLAQKHNPVEGEYLYVYGFPSQDAVAAYGQQHHRGIGVFTHECAYDSILDSETPKIIEGYHICLGYNPEYASVIYGSNSALSRADGISGSLVWNTRFKEYTDRGIQWSPQNSCVTALVWGNPTKAGMLIATPIEYIHNLLGTLA